MNNVTIEYSMVDGIAALRPGHAITWTEAIKARYNAINFKEIFNIWSKENTGLNHVGFGDNLSTHPLEDTVLSNGPLKVERKIPDTDYYYIIKSLFPISILAPDIVNDIWEPRRLGSPTPNSSTYDFIDIWFDQAYTQWLHAFYSGPVIFSFGGNGVLIQNNPGIKAKANSPIRGISRLLIEKVTTDGTSVRNPISGHVESVTPLTSGYFSNFDPDMILNVINNGVVAGTYYVVASTFINAATGTGFLADRFVGSSVQGGSYKVFGIAD